jgi:hypothetical protein
MYRALAAPENDSVCHTLPQHSLQQEQQDRQQLVQQSMSMFFFEIVASAVVADSICILIDRKLASGIGWYETELLAL